MITSFASAASFQPSFGLTELEKSPANVLEPETSRIDPKPDRTRQSIGRWYIISSTWLRLFDCRSAADASTRISLLQMPKSERRFGCSVRCPQRTFGVRGTSALRTAHATAAFVLLSSFACLAVALAKAGASSLHCTLDTAQKSSI